MGGVILIAISLIAGAPALIPFVRRKPAPGLYRWALGLVVASVALQVIFLLACAWHSATVSLNLYFALIGASLCAAGVIVGIVSLGRHAMGLGPLFAGFFTAAWWLMLCMLH